MQELSHRKKLETVLLSAGIMYPLSNPERWDAFLSGADSLPLTALGMDSLSLNELSISIEIRCGVKLSPASLSAFDTAENLSKHIENGGPQAEQSSPVSNFWKRGVTGKVARRLNLVIGDHITTATPWEFLELSGVRTNLHFANRLKFRFLQRSIRVLKTISVFSFHSEQIDRISQIFDNSGLKLDPADWSRERCAKDVLIYRQKQKAGFTSCIIVFGGGLRMPMMPMSLFLAGLGDYTDTVIFVRTTRNQGFRNGISGLGNDIESAFAKLAKLVNKKVPEKNRTIQPPVVIGTSSGGLPALIFSQFLPVGSIVLAGPNSSRDPRWESNRDFKHAIESRKTQVLEGSAAPVTIIYGGIGSDSLFVPDWQSDIPDAQIVEIPGVGHTCLPLLIEEGTFLSFLKNWTKLNPPTEKNS